jgi:hypothetical protein
MFAPKTSGLPLKIAPYLLTYIEGEKKLITWTIGFLNKIMTIALVLKTIFTVMEIFVH